MQLPVFLDKWDERFYAGVSLEYKAAANLHLLSGSTFTKISAMPEIALISYVIKIEKISTSITNLFCTGAVSKQYCRCNIRRQVRKP